jgi:2-hydroxychromene-2-carboxylate isomerase
MRSTLNFFFFYGSIHSYLSVMRIETLANAAGIKVRWRPFNLREILVEQGNTAFVRNQVRLNYNWRDIERRASHWGIPFVGRPPYPVDQDLLALRVGALAACENWCAEYTRATFRLWFVEGKPSGLRHHVEQVLEELGKEAAEILVRAASPEVTERLKLETAAARRLGIFGAPTFASHDEIFWGDDRLEQAIEYARRHA